MNTVARIRGQNTFIIPVVSMPICNFGYLFTGYDISVALL